MSRDVAAPQGSLPRWTATAVASEILLGSALLSPLLFSTSLTDAFELPKVALLVVVASVTTALCLHDARPSRPAAGFSAVLSRDPIGSGLALLLAGSAVSTLFAISPLTALRGAEESWAGLVTMTALVGLYFGTRFVARRVPVFGADLGRSLAVGTPVVSVLAVVQSAGADGIAWARTATFRDQLRPFATLGHPNLMAGFLVAVLPLAVGGSGGRRSDGSRLLPWTRAAVALVALAAVVLSLSRGAWLAAVATTCFLLPAVVLRFRRRAIRWWKPALGALVLSAAAAGFFTLSPRVSSVRERNLSGPAVGARLEMWRAAIRIFRERPVLGAGPDNFHLAFQAHRSEAYWSREYTRTPVRAHNDALHLLAVVGLAGAVPAAGILIALAVATWRSWRGVVSGRLAVSALLPLAGVVALLAYGCFNSLSIPLAGLLVTLLALVSLAAWPSRQQHVEQLSVPPLRVGGTEVAALVAGAALLAARVTDPSALAASVAALGLASVFLAGLWVLVVSRPAVAAQPSAASGLRPPETRHRARRAKGLSERRTWLRPTALAGAALLPLTATWRFVAADLKASAALGMSPSTPGAVRALDEAVSLAPHRDALFVLRSVVERKAAAGSATDAERDRLLDSALADLDTAVRLVPANANHRAARAGVLLELAISGRASASQVLEAWGDALRLDPRHSGFLADAARAALTLGKLDEAAEFAARSRRLHPTFAVPVSQEGDVARRRGDLQTARARYRESLALTWKGETATRFGTLLNLANVLGALGQIELAEETARAALSEQPGSAAARFSLAQALLARGKVEDARSAYRSTLESAPNHPGARAALARLDGHDP